MVEDSGGKDKKKQDTIREWQLRKQMNRWIVGGVFSLMVGLSIWFWWIGNSDDADLFSNDSKVWEAQVSNVEEDNSSKINQMERIDTSDLEEEIEGLVDGLEGKYVVYGKGLDGLKGLRVKEQKIYGWELRVGDQDQVMQAASLIKVPVMVAVYQLAERGEIDLDSIYELKEIDKVGGSGSLVGKPEGYEVDLRQLVWHMGNESDNTAFAVLVSMVGREKLQEEFLRMGLINVSIENNEITPREVAELFEGLYGNRWVREEYSKEILSSMVDTWYEERIPAGVPGEVRVAHKVGTEIGVVGDAGIVYSERGDYLLVIMSERVFESEAKEVVPEIGKAVWEWVEEAYR